MKTKIAIIISTIVLGVSAVIGVSQVKANPSSFVITNQTATATTTLAYLTPGAATTTLYFDSYTNGSSMAVNKIINLVQLTASSTNTVLNVNVEYADMGDCVNSPNTCDWYQDAGTFTKDFATTTKPYDISAVNQFSFRFASSTAGLGSAFGTNRTTRAFSLDLPTRFVRVIFTLPATSGNAGIWAKIVAVRELK